MNLSDPLNDALIFNQTGLVRPQHLEHVNLSELISGRDDASERRKHLGWLRRPL